MFCRATQLLHAHPLTARNPQSFLQIILRDKGSWTSNPLSAVSANLHSTFIPDHVLWRAEQPEVVQPNHRSKVQEQALTTVPRGKINDISATINDRPAQRQTPSSHDPSSTGHQTPTHQAACPVRINTSIRRKNPSLATGSGSNSGLCRKPCCNQNRGLDLASRYCVNGGPRNSNNHFTNQSCLLNCSYTGKHGVPTLTGCQKQPRSL
jgi:hypothetical protein